MENNLSTIFKEQSEISEILLCPCLGIFLYIILALLSPITAFFL